MVNWITSAQRFKALPNIENMGTLVCADKRAIVLNFVLKISIPGTLMSNYSCAHNSFLPLLSLVVGRGAMGRHQQSRAHT